MNKNKFIISLKNLKKPKKSVIFEFDKKRNIIETELNNYLVNLPDLNNIIGENNISMMRNNHKNHFDFISAVFQNFNEEVFINTVKWVFKTYISHNFKPEYWSVFLNKVIELLKINLSENSANQIIPYYKWMLNYHKFYFKTKK